MCAIWKPTNAQRRQWIENETIIYPHFASLITGSLPFLFIPTLFILYVIFAINFYVSFFFHDILQAINFKK